MINDLKKNELPIKRGEALEFYNKYYEQGDFDELYILNTLTNLRKLFVAKVNDFGILNIYNSKDFDFASLKFNLEDKNFSSFERKLLSFYESCNIKVLSKDEVYVDEYLMILSTNAKSLLNKYIGHSALELANDNILERRKAYPLIIQNILVSKLYQAVLEEIYLTSGAIYAELFEHINHSLIAYETNFADHNYAFKPTYEMSRARSSR